MLLCSLSGIPLVHLENRTPDPRWADWAAWARAFEIDTGPKSGAVHFSKISSGLQAAIGGHGLVLCGVTEACDSILAGQLVMPFGPKRHLATSYKYRLLSLRGRPLNPLQKAFCDWVVAQANAFKQTVSDILKT